MADPEIIGTTPEGMALVRTASGTVVAVEANTANQLVATPPPALTTQDIAGSQQSLMPEGLIPSAVPAPQAPPPSMAQQNTAPIVDVNPMLGLSTPPAAVVPQTDSTAPVVDVGQAFADVQQGRENREQLAADAALTRQPGAAPSVPGQPGANLIQTDLTSPEAAGLGGLQDVRQYYMALLQNSGMSPGQRNTISRRLQALGTQQALNADEQASLFEDIMGVMEKRRGTFTSGAQDAGGVFNEVLGSLEGIDEAFVQERQELEQNVDRRQTELDNVATQFATSREVANPLFADMNGAQRFSVALGISMGQALQTSQSILFPGSNPANTALTIVDQAVDREIGSMRSQQRLNMGEVGVAQNLLEVARQSLSDEESAVAWTKAALLGRAEQQLNSIRGRVSGEINENAVAQMMAELRARRAALEGQALAGLRDAEQQRLRRGGLGVRQRLAILGQVTDIDQAISGIGEAAAGRGGGGGWAPPTGTLVGGAGGEGGGAYINDQQQAGLTRGVRPNQGFLSAEGNRPLRDSLDSTLAMFNAMSRIRGALDSNLGDRLSPSTRAIIAQNRGIVLNNARAEQHAGVMNTGEFERFLADQPFLDDSATGVFSLSARASFDQAMIKLREQADRYIASGVTIRHPDYESPAHTRGLDFQDR